MSGSSLTIVNKTKGKLPRLPFSVVSKIKDAVLGKPYALSLIFLDPTESKKLNHTYRGKNNPTDVLSFGYDDTEGELYLSLPQIEEKRHEFNHSFQKHFLFLIIHGCFHLKGMDHGSTMEQKEAQVRARFKV